MRTTTRLTPTQRLTRGLTYTAVGPFDITRGTIGLSARGAHSAGSSLRRRYRHSRVAKELSTAQEAVARELSAAQEVAANLPQAIQDARRPKRARRRAILLTAGVAALIGGAVAFSIVRRSMQPEPSPRPPSVEVAPKP